jgi:hypothetical protein
LNSKDRRDIIVPAGLFLYGRLEIIERFRRPNFGRLEIDVTIDDPKAYTKPWTVRVNQRLLVDTDLIEFVCLENEKFSSGFRN